MLRERLKRFLQLLFVGMPPVSNIKIHTVNSNNCMSQLNNYEFNWKKKKKKKKTKWIWFQQIKRTTANLNNSMWARTPCKYKVNTSECKELYFKWSLKYNLSSTPNPYPSAMNSRKNLLMKNKLNKTWKYVLITYNHLYIFLCKWVLFVSYVKNKRKSLG